MLTTRIRRPATHSVLALRSSRTPIARSLNAPWSRFASSQPQSRGPSSHWLRNSLGFASSWATHTTLMEERKLGRLFRGAKKEAIDVNDLRAQFVQEKRSLKSSAVYTWGSNIYKVVDPGSKDADIKTPRRFKYFDGQVLRDLKIEEKSGAAINEKGDLVQWGQAFSETDFKPSETLTGKNLVSLALSESRIIALSSDGTVYSLPLSKTEQSTGPKSRESSWVPFWASKSNLSYRVLNPSLKLGEKVTSISGGQEHVLLLTSSGRVFSAASSTENYPSLGQLGVEGLTWSTRPKGPADFCHEITAFKGSKIVKIAAGDYHSLALAEDGRMFAFGDNSFGQLGVNYDPERTFKDTPFVVKVNKLYRRGIYDAKVTSIAAGGANTFFSVDSTRILGSEEETADVRDLGNVTADTWSCGRGIWGTLGSGRWVHVQDSPTKIKALSGVSEYDEKTNQITPIRIRAMSVGTTHVSAILDNKTNISRNTKDTLDQSKDWGYDVVWWGGNEHFQLGTGKRSNQAKPIYINAPPETKKQAEARLQIMPRHKGKVGKRNVNMEQRVECGRHVSAIYSAV
ncbi:Mitochondrial protein Fmp25 [Penicillium soppii]|uniref:Mitochondrial protein Fmp25 n=1 Tax=Penicillium soppii TaxID=69789 RepID=UPI0025497F58|nr:Mitochondrial protein Fmp25 [Penicillium soppii]KAJ5861679.1 Mitochondrial protein Fmp25 [Penicillium soppii]